VHGGWMHKGRCHVRQEQEEAAGASGGGGGCFEGSHVVLSLTDGKTD
jgi:hypothetical protein